MINYRSRPDWPAHISAGCVVINSDNQVLLLGRTIEPDGRPGGYHLPKGTLEQDETLKQTAERETEEEAGWRVEAYFYLDAISSEFTNYDGTDCRKTIHYFLAQPLVDCGIFDDEHDSRRFVPAEEAVKLLAMMPKREDGIVLKALEVYSRGK